MFIETITGMPSMDKALDLKSKIATELVVVDSKGDRRPAELTGLVDGIYKKVR